MKCFSIPSLVLAGLVITGCASTAQQEQTKLSGPNPTAVTDSDETEDVSASVTKSEQSLETSTEKLSEQPEPASNFEDIPALPADVWSVIRAGYALPELENRWVKHFDKWNKKHSRYLTTMLKRSERFMPYIVQEIDKRGLPMELALLPAIESAYNPNAYSRSRAAGLWQFIPSTGRLFGMQQNWWADQRRDVILSTQAALDYLTELHQEFDNDWLLALAAYNGGRGTIGKAIRRNQRQGLATDFDALKLRRETTQYVPKLIALAKVIQNPQAYGVSLPEVGLEQNFAVITLPGQTDLRKLVRKTSLQDKDLRELNAGFLRWASSPEGPHRLLVPVEHKLSVDSYLSSLPEQPQIRWRQHKIRNGDTLSGIAKKYRVSIAAIRSINGMRGSFLRAGKHILIPLVDNSAPNAGVAGRTIAAQTKDSGNNRTVHRVRRGDTLWQIARNYRVALTDLISWNKLSQNSTLALNQKLVIYR